MFRETKKTWKEHEAFQWKGTEEKAIAKESFVNGGIEET